ncbi:ABC transporter substrate-binding protein [uncultured Marinobacter sp.]|uniref:ABC transporter substrate-binding protein n=1 Tax=uncultured Marinobacter sp. TaxID=187379 RepID=UPI0030D89F5A
MPRSNTLCRLQQTGLRLLQLTCALSLLTVLPAQADRDLRFTANWAFEASNAPFVLAEQKGYFRDEGLNVRIDAGEGSSAVITRIGSGSYEAGFGDINTLIEFNSRFPENSQRMVYMVYNRPPLAIMTLTRSGIETPADLEGRIIGAPANDTAYRMFPLFADATGINADNIKFESITPNLRETMLVQGRVDAIAAFPPSAQPNLLNLGIDEDDIRTFYFSDYGVPLYSNGLIVTQKMIENEPEVVAGLVRAVNRALKESIADPQMAAEALLKKDSLINTELEVSRMEFLISNQLVTDEVEELGLGAVDSERLEASIEAVSGALGIETLLTADQVFDSSFLPDIDQRRVPAH